MIRIILKQRFTKSETPSQAIFINEFMTKTENGYYFVIKIKNNESATPQINPGNNISLK